MSKMTQEMRQAQGAIIDVRSAGEMASEMAAYVGLPEAGVKAFLGLAAVADLRWDAVDAYGVRFAEVTDWHTLNFEAAAAYVMAYVSDAETGIPGLNEEQALAFAVASAANGMAGHDAEDAIIAHFDFMSDGELDEENDLIDAHGENGEWFQIMKNDSSKKRHDTAKAGKLTENHILVSFAPIEDGKIRVGFEDYTKSDMGYKIALEGC